MNTFVRKFHIVRTRNSRHITNIYLSFINLIPERKLACSLLIISYNVQSLCSNKTTVETLLEKCDIILLQETLLSSLNVNELDDILQNNEISCHTPANLSTSSLGGSPSGGLAIMWKNKKQYHLFSCLFKREDNGSGVKYNIIEVYHVRCVAAIRTKQSTVFTRLQV